MHSKIIKPNNFCLNKHFLANQENQVQEEETL